MAMLGSEPLTVHFPESAAMPEGTWHFKLRALLYDFLVLAFGDVATIGSDQFVYWDPASPRICLSPDAFVCFGAQNEHFRSWKTWERGVPQVAVEVISGSESELTWDEKLERYRRLGVSELVWFDPEAAEHPLRIWDLVEGGLCERSLLQPSAQSRHLGGFWLPIEDPAGGLTLRLSRDEHGRVLFPTAAEQNAIAAEQNAIAAEQNAIAAEQNAIAAEHNARRLRAAEEALLLETDARRAAEQLVAELQAELKRRG